MPKKIKFRDRIKFDFKQPRWKFVLLFFLSLGWLYLLYMAGKHFLNSDTYSDYASCSSCGQKDKAANEDCSSCDSSSPCEK